MGEKAVSCTQLRESQKASSCGRFVSNAHHRLKSVRARMQEKMVLIERDGWGFRRRDRGKGKGLADGVLNGVGQCFFGGTENMRALTWRLLLAASTRLLDRSGSSRTNHQGLTWVLKGLTRLRVRQCSNAQEHLQEEASKVTKPVRSEQRWVRQAVVRTCQNNEINMKVGSNEVATLK